MKSTPPPGESYGDHKDPKHWTGPWEVLREPEHIAKAITIANIRQFHQAYSTPFACGRLADAIGPWAISDTADKILAGEPLPDDLLQGLLPETLRIIEQIGVPPDLKKSPPLRVRITPEMFKSVYKVADEKMDSSPSDRHIGHMKAATHSDALSQVHASMMELPF